QQRKRLRAKKPLMPGTMTATARKKTAKPKFFFFKFYFNAKAAFGRLLRFYAKGIVGCKQNLTNSPIA
ncbi:MAG: hypothetical protein KDI06_19700, partial [Calditrichaeota bacterium]|nr:hypothetical protein [Calditrichota bacterium]